MKKKNGFTLVELIASLALMAMLSTIVITYSIRKINETKKASQEKLYVSIEVAAKNYVTEHWSDLEEFNEKDYMYVSIATLIENNAFTSDLVDPITDKAIPESNVVYVTRSYNGNITASYDSEQNKNPSLRLNGNYNMYITQDSEFNDPGVSAYLNDGTDISEDVNVESNVDTNNIGNYIVTYSYENIELKRNIIVKKRNSSSGEQELYLADYIENLYQDENLRDVNGLIKDTSYDKNIRYSGSNISVNNYIEFNDELWRIIGVFNVSNGSETEKRVKLVRNDSIGIYSWDSTEETVNEGYGTNEWSNSKIKSLLNDKYYNSLSSTCYTNSNLVQESCNFTSKGLNSSSKELIENVKWSIGKVNYEGTEPYTLFVDDVYTAEETETWTGLVGLINISDYSYASGNPLCQSNIRNGITIKNDDYNVDNCICNEKNWLYKSTNYWTISGNNSNNNEAFNVIYKTVGSNYSSNAYNIYPTVYLKSIVKLVDGTGTETNPYIISIDD